nr:hypothetical protein GCM10020185_42770 [Pseudomonas brassicacearum subsp. brassicacearum]
MAVQARLVLAGQGGGTFGVVGQLLEEVFEQFRVEFETGRKLPEDRAQLLLELQHAGGEEIGQGLADVPQALDVGDETRGLDAEHEAGRCLGVPLGIPFGALQGVERSIDFDAVDRSRGELQFPFLGQPLGVEVPRQGV